MWTSCREGKNGWKPDFPIGSVIRTNAYLYAPSFFFTDGKTYPFTLRSIAYSTGVSGAAWECEIVTERYADNGRPGTDTLRLRAIVSLP